MTKDTTKAAAAAADIFLFDDWSDAIEDGVRARARGFIKTISEEDLDAALSHPRYGRRKPCDDETPPRVVGCRHGHRERTPTGTFGKTRIAVPRALLSGWTARRASGRANPCADRVPWRGVASLA